MQILAYPVLTSVISELNFDFIVLLYFFGVVLTVFAVALTKGRVTPASLVLNVAPITASSFACGPSVTVLEQPDATNSAPATNNSAFFILIKS